MWMFEETRSLIYITEKINNGNFYLRAPLPRLSEPFEWSDFRVGYRLWGIVICMCTCLWWTLHVAHDNVTGGGSMSTYWINSIALPLLLLLLLPKSLIFSFTPWIFELKVDRNLTTFSQVTPTKVVGVSPHLPGWRTLRDSSWVMRQHSTNYVFTMASFSCLSLSLSLSHILKWMVSSLLRRALRGLNTIHFNWWQRAI